MKNTIQNLERQRTKCEVYSRVVGYLRPVKQWNDGKQAEFYDRKEYNKVLDLSPLAKGERLEK